MAVQLLVFHCWGGTEAHGQTGPSSRGRPLGVPPTHLYSSIAYALTDNKRLLGETSPSFREICFSIKTGNFVCSVKDQVKHINFAMMTAARLVHHAKFEYNINKTMRQEIEFCWDKLLPESNIVWETPIAHIIPWMPTFTAFGDSCLEGARGYSTSLGFWWHIPFPDAVR